MFGSLLLSFLLSASASGRPFPLMVGDPAPPLPVSRWVKGEPVTRFEPGRVYVIESWATWCEPCRACFPHLSEIQRRYSGNVKVASVSIWEESQANVAPFVAKHGDAMDYAVALDSVPAGQDGFHGRFAKQWIEAAGYYSRGVPAAFIVDRGGRIAWIGHPLEADSALAAVVTGAWDLKAEAARYAERRSADLRSEPLIVKYYEGMRAKDPRAMVVACEQLIALDPARFSDYLQTKYGLLNRDLSSPERALSFVRETAESQRDIAPVQLALAWSLLGDTARVHDPEAMKIAHTCAERADELGAHRDADALHALARSEWLQGRHTEAIETEQRALALAPPADQARIAKWLDAYRARVRADSAAVR